MPDKTNRSNDAFRIQTIDESAGAPPVVDRAVFEAQLAELRIEEKAHSRAGDAIAAKRRGLPMVEIDAGITIVGPNGNMTLLDVFEGRRQLIVYYYMWFEGRSAAQQCEGCSFYTSQVHQLSFIHSRDVTYATFCQGPFETSERYRNFMGFEMPWYSVQGDSLNALLIGRKVGMMHLICYLRRGKKVFETYWTTRRGVEAMDNSYRLLDLTVYGRQENWEDSPEGWPQLPKGVHPYRIGGRPIVQWPRLRAGYNEDLSGGATAE